MHCISVSKDKCDHIYTEKNIYNCINCHKCEHVCPALNEPEKNCAEYALGAVSRTTETIQTSTSGGAAYEIGKKIIEAGGVAYGCAWEGTAAKHIRVDNIEELRRLQKSKYVQSSMLGIYQKIQKDLSANFTVVFFGTPCQVAAVRNYCNKHSENLLLVDLICHGTPSQQMLDEHIQHCAGSKNPCEISFRDKEQYLLKIKDNTGNIIFSKGQLRDEYLMGFLSGSTIRQSCTTCKYASIQRCSDITLGDFWGAKEIPVDKSLGLSLILPNTRKGEEFLNTLDSLITFKRPIKEAIEGNYHLSKAGNTTVRNNLFRRLYSIMPFETAVIASNLDKYIKAFVNSLRH